MEHVSRVYADALGNVFARLPEPIRRAHGAGLRYTGHGSSTVIAGHNPVARLAIRLFGFPLAGTGIPMHFTVIREQGREIWVRRFGARRFASTHERRDAAGPGMVIERFGALTFFLAVAVEGDRITVTSRGMRAFGIPVPSFLVPRVRAEEWAEGDRFGFDVDIRLSWIGRLVRYRGLLDGQAAMTPEPVEAIDPSMIPDAVLLFDGTCNLCCGGLGIFAEYDASGTIRYCANQSETGRALLARHGYAYDADTPAMLIEGDRVHVGAAAVMRAVRSMRFPWNLLAVFDLVPASMQNAVYRLIAKTRYRLFGRRPLCSVPTPAFRARFLS